MLILLLDYVTDDDPMPGMLAPRSHDTDSLTIYLHALVRRYIQVLIGGALQRYLCPATHETTLGHHNVDTGKQSPSESGSAPLLLTGSAAPTTVAANRSAAAAPRSVNWVQWRGVSNPSRRAVTCLLKLKSGRKSSHAARTYA